MLDVVDVMGIRVRSSTLLMMMLSGEVTTSLQAMEDFGINP